MMNNKDKRPINQRLHQTLLVIFMGLTILLLAIKILFL